MGQRYALVLFCGMRFVLFVLVWRVLYYYYYYRIVLFVFFLLEVCEVLVWDYVCRVGTKTDTMAALGGSNQHHYHYHYHCRCGAGIFNIIVGFIFTFTGVRDGGVRGGFN